jgi:hypothetical protein
VIVPDAEVMVVKVGVGETLIVEVPDSVMLSPALRLVSAVVKSVFQADEDAVRGILYAAATYGV